MKRTGNLDVDMIWEIPSVRCCPFPCAARWVLGHRRPVPGTLPRTYVPMLPYVRSIVLYCIVHYSEGMEYRFQPVLLLRRQQANTLSGRVAAVPSIESIRAVRREGLMRLRTQKHTSSGSRRPTWPASKWLSRWYGRSRKPQRLPPGGESDAAGPLLCLDTRTTRGLPVRRRRDFGRR